MNDHEHDRETRHLAQLEDEINRVAEKVNKLQNERDYWQLRAFRAEGFQFCTTCDRNVMIVASPWCPLCAGGLSDPRPVPGREDAATLATGRTFDPEKP